MREAFVALVVRATGLSAAQADAYILSGGLVTVWKSSCRYYNFNRDGSYYLLLAVNYLCSLASMHFVCLCLKRSGDLI